MLTHPEGFLEARERHYQKFFGPLTRHVVHSTDVKPVHIDIYQFEPIQGRSYWTLVTGGMSNERQLDPDQAEVAEHDARCGNGDFQAGAVVY